MRPFLLLSIHFLTAFSTTCYYLDGTIAEAETPCTNATVSACCGSGGYCLDSGLCVTDLILNRGSCTDQFWHAAECAQYCQASTFYSVLLPLPSMSFVVYLSLFKADSVLR
jgi:hypothetical protein